MKTKKDLKQEFKRIKPRMGVFQIRNTVSGKIFVGSSVNVEAMWNRCKMQLNWGAHPNACLQRDWKEIGENSFVFEVISDLAYKKDESDSDYAGEVKELEAIVRGEMSDAANLLY